MDLLASEIRVLGCLLEKQRTTPDQYPLTLNALRLACNQSTNRDPVVEYDEATIKDALHRLERRGFARFAGGVGSRAPKFRHLLSEALPMQGAEQAAMCVMMLRGPQTPGEIKQRGERLHSFAGMEEVDETLSKLMDRGLVRRLERRRGQKEERYAQTLAGQEAEAQPTASPAGGGEITEGGGLPVEAGWTPSPSSSGAPSSGVHPSAAAEVERLARRVEALEAEMQAIKRDLGLEPARAGHEPAAAQEPHAQARPVSEAAEARTW